MSARTRNAGWQRPAPTPRQKVLVNAAGTEMRVPGVGEQPIVGIDKKDLDAKAQEHAKRKVHLERQMRSEWQCLQCKRIHQGTLVRVKHQNIGGTKTEVLVCPDPKCDGPVVIWRDALSLIQPPKGAV